MCCIIAPQRYVYVYFVIVILPILSILLKENCIDLQENIIKHIIAIGSIWNDQYLIVISSKWLLINATIYLDDDKLEHFAIMDNNIYNLWPLLDISDQYRNNLIGAYMPGCINKLVLKFDSSLPTNLYWSITVDMTGPLPIVQSNETRMKEMDKLKHLLTDCDNRILYLFNNDGVHYLVLFDGPNQRYNVCISKSQLNQLKIGTTKNLCPSGQSNDSFLFTNISTGFSMNNNEQVYLLSNRYLLTFSRNAFKYQDHYTLLTIKFLHDYFQCVSSVHTGKKLIESDIFISNTSLIMFSFFFITSLMMAYFMITNEQNESQI